MTPLNRLDLELLPGGKQICRLDLETSGVTVMSEDYCLLQVALKNSLGIFYFSVDLPLRLFACHSIESLHTFTAIWEEDTCKALKVKSNLSLKSVEEKSLAFGCIVITSNEECLQAVVRLSNGVAIALEASREFGETKLEARSSVEPVLDPFLSYFDVE